MSSLQLRARALKPRRLRRRPNVAELQSGRGQPRQIGLLRAEVCRLLRVELAERLRIILIIQVRDRRIVRQILLSGERGLRDARATARQAATLLGVRPTQIAIASTGIIGVPLPMGDGKR